MRNFDFKVRLGRIYEALSSVFANEPDDDHARMARSEVSGTP